MVTDNGSTDGTADAVARRHPGVRLLRPGRNLGAVGRNLARTLGPTPYVAFCDDDTWWAPGSLAAAADLLDAAPGAGRRSPRGSSSSPTAPRTRSSRELRDSPVPRPDWLPGPALGSFLAAATVLRTDAFRAAGGFSPGCGSAARRSCWPPTWRRGGWWLVLRRAPDGPPPGPPAAGPHPRRRHGIRNTLWFTWLRRPRRPALRRTLDLARTVPRDAASGAPSPRRRPACRGYCASAACCPTRWSPGCACWNTASAAPRPAATPAEPGHGRGPHRRRRAGPIARARSLRTPRPSVRGALSTPRPQSVPPGVRPSARGPLR